MDSAFEKAKKALTIKSVNLRSSNIFLDYNMEPFELEKLNLETQTFRGVQKFKEISMQSEGQSWWEYNFFYAVGIRLVNETNDDSKEGDSEESPLLQIMATFNALYRADEKLDNDVLEAFSEQNVGYHVWPYWRELVQSSCARLNVSTLEVPFYFCMQ
ncbi:MAG: hypothetical protein M0P64_04920 [Candidatus Pacebacteria bacterium]|jgi:hypothetical protein|uniref:hypothetical protein n=1 Tax=Methylobacter sp. TaxID=2051955 RepID=UPI002488F243|nr:hypothetical protein [Methylobacter sp.]MCK9345423.1 hypothetical protein [Candidatus Paceibacterota bacterium]MDI1276302.1 hypothetical protein [Methylobacter sp.]MDI1356986.1 hypothetical protein [Methylobacter sp.]